MAVSYRFTCPICGVFDVDHPFAHAPREEGCPDCGRPSPRVLSATFQFPYGGRAAFHDGPAHNGSTVRETAMNWRESAKARGLEPETTTRWI